MVQHVDWSKPVSKSLVIMGLWTIVILLISSITLFSVIQEGMSMSIPVIIYYEFLCMSPWIVLTPGIMWLARRYSFAEKLAFPIFAVHLVAMTFVFVLHTLVQSYVVSVQYDLTLSWEYLQRDFLGFLDMRVMLYVGILLVVYGVDFHQKNREAKLREPRLRADLNRAKFQALLNNIQPGFMLKTIAVINEKLLNSVDEAEEVLTDFSDLLRLMLNSVNEDEVTVKEDIRACQLYLNILQKRADHPVEKRVIVEPGCWEAMVPSFLILIPILENMIRYGDEAEQKITTISYEVKKHGACLHLQIVLMGLQLDSIDRISIKNGVEVSDMIKHLQLKYGSQVDFSTETANDKVTMKLTIPFHMAETEKKPEPVGQE